MEALVPALVAVLLAGIGDRPALRLARLADAFGAGFALGAAALAQGAVIAVAVAGGLFVAPMLNPNARALIVAVALLLAGAGGLRAMRRDDAALTGRAGSLVELLAMALTDRAAFIVFALAARGPLPILAGVGGLIGALLLGAVAATLGAADWRRMPRAVPLAAALLLLIAGIVLALGALRLI